MNPHSTTFTIDFKSFHVPPHKELSFEGILFNPDPGTANVLAADLFFSNTTFTVIGKQPPAIQSPTLQVGSVNVALYMTPHDGFSFDIIGNYPSQYVWVQSFDIVNDQYRSIESQVLLIDNQHLTHVVLHGKQIEAVCYGGFYEQLSPRIANIQLGEASVAQAGAMWLVLLVCLFRIRR